MSADSTPYAVEVPITNGVRTVNFFNGRLLAAEDLQREQLAGRQLRQRLATAVGDGVVDGLTVRIAAGSTISEPVVQVSAGTALNREGTALKLPTDVDVSLAKPRGSGATAAGVAAQRCAGGDFAPCTGLTPGAPFTESGVYLLTVRPAQAPVGRAPVSGLGNEAAACNTDASAEGVAFDVLHLNLEPELLADEAHLRNRLAHRIFGTEDPSNPERPRRFRLERDPFGTPPTGYGLLDDLRPSCLCDDEVPLALVFWTPGVGIRFVDMWSVRRQVTRRSASAQWPELVGDRRPAEGEAIFLQFQEQIAEAVRAESGLELVRAADRFAYLPAAGLVPLTVSAHPSGFDPQRFFTGIPTRAPVPFMEGVQLEQLLRASFLYPPVDISSGEMLWLYVVRENSQAAQVSPLTVSAQPYVVFAAASTPYAANARFDLSRADFSNYALQLP